MSYSDSDSDYSDFSTDGSGSDEGGSTEVLNSSDYLSSSEEEFSSECEDPISNVSEMPKPQGGSNGEYKKVFYGQPRMVYSSNGKPQRWYASPPYSSDSEEENQPKKRVRIGSPSNDFKPPRTTRELSVSPEYEGRSKIYNKGQGLLGGKYQRGTISKPGDKQKESTSSGPFRRKDTQSTLTGKPRPILPKKKANTGYVLGPTTTTRTEEKESNNKTDDETRGLGGRNEDDTMAAKQLSKLGSPEKNA